MKRIVKAAATLLFGMSLGGCSSSGAGNTQTGGTSGNDQCDQFDNCFQRCHCQTQDSDACVTACQTTSGGAGGQGGASGSGQGGTTGSGGSGQGGTAGSGTGGTSGSGTGGASGSGTGGASGSGTGGAGGAPGTQTATIRTAPFTLGPGQEAFRCQNFANPFPEDVAVLTSESFMTAGSHHMFVFITDSNADSGTTSQCSGLEFGPYAHSAQTPQGVIRYPDGVGRRINRGSGLRVMMHYLNPGSQAYEAELTVNFHYVPANQIQHEAGSVFLNNILGINVPPQSPGSASQTCTLGADAKIIGAVSHMHQYSTHFSATTSTGQTIYEGTDWDEPEARAFTPPLELSAGTRITWRCEYFNTETFPLRFGDSAVGNEMCILSGTYFPAPGGAGLNCQ